MIFMIECIVACALFTVALEILCAKRREVFTNPAICQRYFNIFRCCSDRISFVAGGGLV